MVSALEKAGDILPDNVKFNVDTAHSDLKRMQIRVRPCVGDDGHTEDVVGAFDDGQADTIDGD